MNVLQSMVVLRSVSAGRRIVVKRTASTEAAVIAAAAEEISETTVHAEIACGVTGAAIAAVTK